jgi:hypothetical protein
MKKFDLSKLKQLAGNEVEEANNKKSNSSDYPLVYPGENGTFRVKLLYNPKADLLQRKIIRHTVGKNKMPCLSVYGEDCPICEAVNNAENKCGKECGAFRKYGYKTRGICFAVLMDYDDGMFKDGPNKGDVILLMYPVTLYNKFNEIIMKSGEHLENLVASNYGKTIEITRSQKSGGFPDYNASVYPYGDEKVRETDEEFEKLLDELPNLNERMIPANPTEEDRQKVAAAVETINAEFINSSVINPNQEPESVSQHQTETTSSISGDRPANVQKTEQHTEEVPNSPQPVSQEMTNNTSGKPECFGCHSDTEQKCLICPCEPDCVLANM